MSASPHKVSLCVPFKINSLLSPQPLATTSLNFLTVLLVENRLFHRILRMDFQGPCTGDCGVAKWFICVEGCPQIANVPSPSIPPRKKSNLVLSQQGQSKSRCQSFCFTLKLSPFVAHAVCCGPSSCYPTWSHAPRWESLATNAAGAGYEREIKRERERALFPPLELLLAWVWGGPDAFSKEPISFPIFPDLIGLHPLVRMTGLCGPAPPPVPPSNPVPEGEGGGLIPLVEHRCGPLGCEAAASWWREQAPAAPQFMHIDANFLRSPFLVMIS